MKFNIAIDGPSAAGKSTIADILADKLGYIHLDTGAMYRAVAYKCKLEEINLNDEDNIVKIINNMNLDMMPNGSVVLDEVDISTKIRTNEMSTNASKVSQLLGVRNALVHKQQEICKNGGYILDGRDIGTVVLKDAPIKIYMVASSVARANRRVKQNIEKGIEGSDFEKILSDIEARDYQDTHRQYSPLIKADDAIEIDTSNLSIDEVVEIILQIINSKLGA